MSIERKDRYYSKEKYEAAIGTFAVAIVFLFVAILSIVLDYINYSFIGLEHWGKFMFIPAFFIFIGGFTQIYTNMKFKKAIRAALMERGQGPVKLEDLSLEVGIKPKDVLRVLVDLRAKGLIAYKINQETGEIILGEKVQYAPHESYVAPPKQLQEALSTTSKNFCVYCGHKIREGARFCENCGSEL